MNYQKGIKLDEDYYTKRANWYHITKNLKLFYTDRKTLVL